MKTPRELSNEDLADRVIFATCAVGSLVLLVLAAWGRL